MAAQYRVSTDLPHPRSPGARLEFAIMSTSSSSISISSPADVADILTPDACEFLAQLQQEFGERRLHLLAARDARRRELADLEPGAPFDFPAETAHIRDDVWAVAPAPKDLNDRRVEITGPVDRKMM